MTRALLFLLAVLCAAPAFGQPDAPPFSGTPALLKGRSGGQTLNGGTQPTDSLTLHPTANSAMDATAGLFAGAQLYMGRSGSPVQTWFSRGAKTYSGALIPILLTDGGTWTVQGGATCANVGGEDATWCLAADVPHDCCTGFQTGSCGYCNGTVNSYACDSDDDCASGAAYISQWWHTIDYAGNPNAFESFSPMVFAPMITVSGGGTRALGHQAFLADAGPRYYLTSAANTNMTLSSVDGILGGPIFTRLSGSNTGTVGRVTGFYMVGGPGSAGWTIDDWIGFTMQDPTDGGGSTITDLGLADVPNLTGGSTGGQTFALRSAITSGTHKHFLLDTGGAQSKITGKVRIGDTTAPSAQLEVIGASSLGSSASINASGTTTSGTVLLNLLNENLTVGSGGGVSAIIGGGTVTLSANPNALGVGNFFQHTTTYRNTDGAGANDATNVTVAGSLSLAAAPTFTADDNTGAMTLTNGLLGNAAYTGLFFMPTFGVEEGGTGTVARAAAVTVGGAAGVGSGWTATDWTGVWMKNPASGGTYSAVQGLDCEDLTRGTTNACVRSVISLGLCAGGANAGLACTVDGDCPSSTCTIGTNRYFLAHTGQAPSVISGKVSIGPTSLAAPSARLHVAEQTINSEVARLESVATNDDPNYRVFQYRTTSTGNVTVTLFTHDLTANKVALVEARIVGVCTASCGTVGTGGAAVMVGRAKDLAGTASEIGAEVMTVAVAEDTDGSWGTPTFGVSAGNVTGSLATSGDADIVITWHTTLIVQDVGS